MKVIVYDKEYYLRTVLESSNWNRILLPANYIKDTTTRKKYLIKLLETDIEKYEKMTIIEWSKILQNLKLFEI